MLDYFFISIYHRSIEIREGYNMGARKEEKLYIDTTGNLYRGSKPLGGKLKISDTKISFEWYKPNIPEGNIYITFNDIAEVKKVNTYLFVPNAMVIKLKNGTEYKFVLSDRENIYNTIASRVK